MSDSIIAEQRQFDGDPKIWESLKQAIAKTSGFECWQQENTPDEELDRDSLDRKVTSYLRETLETLAY